LFRALAGLPESEAYFPEITLRNGKLHRKTGAAPEPLETATTAFGFTTSGLALLLNPSPLQVDAEEQVAAARLVHWTRQSAAARVKQVETAVAIAKRKLQESDRKLGLAGQPLSRCIWVSDIRHQGRAKFSVMAEALRSSDPDRALMEIGLSRYRERIETVKECIGQLTTEGTIAGKKYEDLW
jgi:hypothetical protein